MNQLKLILLLLFIDFPFSFGVHHILGCLFNAPDAVIGGLSTGLTIFANLFITMLKFK